MSWSIILILLSIDSMGLEVGLLQILSTTLKHVIRYVFFVHSHLKNSCAYTEGGTGGLDTS